MKSYSSMDLALKCPMNVSVQNLWLLQEMILSSVAPREVTYFCQLWGWMYILVFPAILGRAYGTFQHNSQWTTRVSHLILSPVSAGAKLNNLRHTESFDKTPMGCLWPLEWCWGMNWQQKKSVVRPAQQGCSTPKLWQQGLPAFLLSPWKPNIHVGSVIPSRSSQWGVASLNLCQENAPYEPLKLVSTCWRSRNQCHSSDLCWWIT